MMQTKLFEQKLLSTPQKLGQFDTNAVYTGSSVLDIILN